MLPHLQVNRDQLLAAAQQGHATATDLADYLVRKEVPFRDAHEIVGRAVQYAVAKHKRLDELSVQELQNFSPQIEEDVFDILSLQGSVNSKNTYGGTSPQQVAAQIKRAYQRLKEFGSS